MPNPEALQVFGTLMERLQVCIGMPISVYLSGVHAMLEGHGPGGGPGMGPGTGPGVPCPPGWGPGYGPGYGPGVGRPGGNWPGVPSADSVDSKRELRSPCPPCPGPAPTPSPVPPAGGGMTTVVQGILAFAGDDYLIVNVAMNATNFREVAIPYSAVGMIFCGGVQM